MRLKNEDIDSLLLNPAVERGVDSLVKQLGDLDDVTKELLRADATVRTACEYVDPVLEGCPS